MNPPDWSLQYWGHFNHVWSYITRSDRLLNDEKRWGYTPGRRIIESTARPLLLFVHSQDHFSQRSHSLAFSRLPKKGLTTTERSGILGARWRQDVRREFLKESNYWRRISLFHFSFFTFCCTLSFTIQYKVSWEKGKVIGQFGATRGAMKAHQSPAARWQTRWARAKKLSKAQLLTPSRTHSALLLMLFRFSWCSSLMT